ncbi:MAG: hydrolase [Gammaproteobacteria bacterium]|nr:hydrolase [Gammaproteobacteria bacterium]
MSNTRPFKPAWWLPGAHAQTLWPHLLRRRPKLSLRRERLELPDGDFLDLDWTTAPRGPILLVLHGLEGSIHSPYAAGILRACHGHGWRAVLMHFRGCSGEPNRLARGYHSGETGDLHYVAGLLKKREPETPLCAVGYSLGGNVLLKWLGERGKTAPLAGAVAVSVPFELGKAADRLEHGFSRLYQWALLRQLRRSMVRKARRVPLPIRVDGLRRLKTFRQFDEHVTAPLHGFRDARDYYTRSSSRRFLRHIEVPTLILHARDDPFLAEDAIPRISELSPAVSLDLSSRGGHVGFVTGRLPGSAGYWLETRIVDYLSGIFRCV